MRILNIIIVSLLLHIGVMAQEVKVLSFKSNPMDLSASTHFQYDIYSKYYLWLVPVASVVAQGMAWFFFRQMMDEDEGTERMKEIALHVRRGTKAYLKQLYKVVGIVFVVLALIFSFMAYVLHVQNLWDRSPSSPAIV